MKRLVLILGLVLSATMTASPVIAAQKDASPFTPYAGYDPDPCYKSGDHEAADLCAQWRAALAAERSADQAERALYIAIVSAILSAMGLIGILLSLRQTDRSLREAKNANAIALETSKRELRAYVTTEDHEISDFQIGLRTGYRCKVYNRGQTPAYDVEIWSFTTSILSGSIDPSDVKIRRPAKPFSSRTIIGPGQFVVHENASQIPLTDDAFLAVASGGLIVIWAGVVTYRDAFGRKRRTTFKQLFTGDGSGPPRHLSMLACSRGNIAS